MKKLSKFLIIIITFITIITMRSYAEEDKKIIIFMINRLTIEDIEKMDFVKNLAENGSIGLLNTRGYGHNNDYSSVVSMGSGTRSDATYYTVRSHNSSKDYKTIYNRRVGYMNNMGEIINLDIANLINLNFKNDYNPFIGALGNSLNHKKIKTTVVGNSDITDREVRFAPLLVMDEYGQVDHGDIDNNNIIEDANYPYGKKTNYDYLFSWIEKNNNQSKCIVFELGDIYRLDKYKNNLTNEKYSEHKNRILNDMDIFVKRVYETFDSEEFDILIISPYPASKAYENGYRLTPIIRYNNNLESSLLTSDTTRREGIVANIDIAPYISNYFDANVDKYTGLPLYSIKKNNNLEFIKKLNENVAFVYVNRPYILYSFVIFEIVVSIITFLVIQIEGIHKKYILTCIEYLLLFIMTIPLSLLIVPVFDINNLGFMFLTIILLSIAITQITIIITKKAVDRVIILTGITCIMISIDIINNGYLIKRSFLGYDPIIGARYYGLGNEYMGILISSTLIFITALKERLDLSKSTVGIFLIIIAIIIGFPSLGANVGGTITGVFAFMFVFLKYFNEKLEIKHFIYIIISVVLLISIIALVDIFIIKSSSHLGNALFRINKNGSNEIFSIIKRKLSMNIKLFTISIWSKVLVLTIVFMGMLFYRPIGVMKRIFDRYKNLSIGLLGTFIGCIVGFIVNDSGVVAAATSVIFLGTTLMYLVIKDIKEKLNIER